VLDVILLQGVPASYRVSAYYYLARTELNNDRIAEGLEKLEKAFRECKADSDNVKHILRVLIPVSGRGRGQGAGGRLEAVAGGSHCQCHQQSHNLLKSQDQQQHQDLQLCCASVKVVVPMAVAVRECRCLTRKQAAH
jgi:hypothetical protein